MGLSCFYKKVGSVAYKLDLPVGSKLHPVFHVYKLKKKVGQDVQPCPVLPSLTEEGYLHPFPEARLVKRGNAADVEDLVQWQGTSEPDATWERFKTLEEKSPDVNLVNKVDIRGKD